MSLPTILFKIWFHSSEKSRWMVVGCFALMLTNALAELITLGSVGPFIYALANPQKTLDWLARLESWLTQWSPGTKLTEILRISGENPIKAAAILFISATVSACLVRIIFIWFSLKTANQVTRDFGIQAFSSALFRPYERQLLTNSSEIITSLSKATAVTSTVTNFLGMINALVLCACLVSALMIYQASVTIPVIALLCVLYGFFGLINRRTILAEGKSIAKNQTAVMKTVQESLGSIREIILENLQITCVGAYDKKDSLLRSARARVNFISSYPKALFEALGIALLVGVSFFAFDHQGHQTELLALIGAFAFAGQRLLPGLHQIFSGWTIISNHTASVQDVLNLVESNPKKLNGAPNSLSALSMRRVLKLVDVKYAYQTRKTPVLEGINMKIEIGHWVGIAGGTGCGKSSLLDLMMGLLVPSSGFLEVDGQKIGAQNLSSWMRNFSLVPQHVYLLDGSIEENISFFSPQKISHEVIRYAASLALVEEFVAEMPLGFDTRVGERGLMLSGGQRQRLGIARALARRTPFLVLDEATNALDEKTERRLLENLRKISRNTTVLMVSHHPRSLAFCDSVFEIRKGKAQMRASISPKTVVA